MSSDESAKRALDSIVSSCGAVIDAAALQRRLSSVFMGRNISVTPNGVSITGGGISIHSSFQAGASFFSPPQTADGLPPERNPFPSQTGNSSE